MSKFKYVAMASAIAISALSSTAAFSQSPNNNFFGSGPYLPGAVGSIDGNDTPAGSMIGGNSAAAAPSSPAQSAPAANVGGNGLPGVGPDNTADEKRMQKKYKANINYFKDLINKGQGMMERSPNKESAIYKKGKILKETGEKHLTELQTSSPFQIDPSLADEADKRTKKKNGKS
ncbi:MAG TPA: hypothetical protein V6C69_06825 [Trichormus sp.]|jgi:hypothetical protein